MKLKILFGGSSLSDEEGPPFVPNTCGSSQSLAYFHISTIIKSNEHSRAVVKRGREAFYSRCTQGAVFFSTLWEGVECRVRVDIVRCIYFSMITLTVGYSTWSPFGCLFYKNWRRLEMLQYAFCALFHTQFTFITKKPNAFHQAANHDDARWVWLPNFISLKNF